MADSSDEHRAAFNAYLRENGSRNFTRDTWNLYVEYLRDGVDPAPKAGSNIPANKYSINKRYYWGGSELIYKLGDKITIRQDRIFDTLAFEYARSSYTGRLNFWKEIQQKYHGITMNDTFRFVDDYKKFHVRAATKTNNDQNNAIIEDDDVMSDRQISDYVGKSTEPNGTQYPGAYDEGRGGSPVQDLPPSKETQRWIDWLKDMRDGNWPRSLEHSRYRDIISGLSTILEAARPAGAYVGGGEAPVGLGSASYNSADLLCLTMQQATQELERSEGPAKPILIRGDTTAVKGLKTIDYYLNFIRDWGVVVAVQDPSRRRDQPSGTTWPVEKVISRFETGSKPLRQQPPINLLNLDCLETNPTPECFSVEAMNYLPKLRVVGNGRPSEGSALFWNKVEKWRLLAQGGSGSLAHCDHCGFWTWVKVDEGKRLWLLCQLSEEDWAEFAERGLSFTGGQWSYVWLEPGDVLIMPPGTVHAVFTPENTLCVGGNAWSQKRMGDTMRSIAFETTHPVVTNSEEVVQLPDLLEKTYQRMIVAPIEGYTADFGGEGQMEEFSRYYKVPMQPQSRPYIPPR
jgi:Cupin superfamily protein